LPSIGRDLGFAEENLQWVITAYALTFGGFLLLGGRAADLLGRRRIFMVGLALFTVASLACGLSQNEAMLIGARGVQGLGAAIVSPAALSIISVTFTEGSERNKALGAWGAVGGSGAAAGVLFGGILTKYLGWEWIFFVNIPVGIVVLALAARFVRESRQQDAVHEYDVLGALSVTSGLVALVYAISEAPDVGWLTFRTIGLLVLAGALLLFFVVWEARERAPLMPLGIFRNRMLTAANVVGILQSAGIFGSFLLLTFYMQQVLGLSVLQTGVGFLATAGTAVLMAAPAQALVTRFGPKFVTLIGMSLLTAGSLWYTQIDVDGSYSVDLLPGFLAVGIGIAFSYIPITIAALAGVSDRDAGLAAGLLNTSQQVGGAIGVAVISTVSFTHFETLVANGTRPDVALTEGFQWGFWVTAGIWVAALIAAVVLIRRMEIPTAEEAAAPTAV
jgi:EmrB/QacA subfamily drug resistance transporter